MAWTSLAALADRRAISGERLARLAEVCEQPITASEWSGAPGSRLVIPTHVTPAGGQTTHPSIVFVPDGWNGYRYWLAHTPYPGGVDSHEDPNICASHDGITWVVPAGLTNPIDDQGGSPGAYNSDNDLRLGPDGKLYLFWRTYDSTLGSNQEKLWVSSSSDGITWAAKRILYQTNQTTRRLVSPAFLWDGGRWWMWAVDALPSPNQVVRLQGPATDDPVGAWGAPTVCNIGAMQSGKEPWHMDLIEFAGRYVMLINDTLTDQSGPSGDMILLTSADGLTFTNSGGPIIPRALAGEYDQIYRATLVPSFEDGRLGFRVWYAAWLTGPPIVWNVYRTWIGPPVPAVKATAYGQWVTPAINMNTSASSVVNFPAGLFSAAPHVTYFCDQGRYNLAVSNLTKDGVTLIAANFSNANASAGSVVYWQAVEK